MTDAHYAECATNDGEAFACDCHATVDGEAALTAAEYEQAYRTHERDEARDLAFRAAFADEEGSEVQWGIQYAEDRTVSWVGSEASARSLTHSTPEALRRRIVPPWKPVPVGPVPQEKP